MNQIIANFNKLLGKYKFTNDIPEDVRKYAISSSKNNLISILRISNNYSFIFGKILSIYIAARKIKIGITFAQSKVILFLFTIAAAVIVVFSSLLIINSFSKIISNNKQRESISESADSNISSKIENPDENSLNSKQFIIGVDNLTGDSDAQIITGKITSGLKAAIGNDKVTLLDEKKRNKVGKIVMGSIRKIGKGKYVNVKIVDTETSSVVYAISEKYSSADELDEACERLTKIITSKIK